MVPQTQKMYFYKKVVDGEVCIDTMRGLPLF
jgi:hypothetical protein